MALTGIGSLRGLRRSHGIEYAGQGHNRKYAKRSEKPRSGALPHRLPDVSPNRLQHRHLRNAGRWTRPRVLHQTKPVSPMPESGALVADEECAGQLAVPQRAQSARCTLEQFRSQAPAKAPWGHHDPGEMRRVSTWKGSDQDGPLRRRFSSSIRRNETRGFDQAPVTARAGVIHAVLRRPEAVIVVECPEGGHVTEGGGEQLGQLLPVARLKSTDDHGVGQARRRIRRRKRGQLPYRPPAAGARRQQCSATEVFVLVRRVTRQTRELRERNRELDGTKPLVNHVGLRATYARREKRGNSAHCREAQRQDADATLRLREQEGKDQDLPLHSVIDNYRRPYRHA